MSWKDEEIDKLFQDKAENLSFEYKDDYWKEFSASLPLSASEGGSAAVDEVDIMYKDEAKSLSFAYKEAYWTEMAAMLRRKRRPDIVWFGMAVAFLGLLTATIFMAPNVQSFSGGERLVAGTETKVLVGDTGNLIDANAVASIDENTASDNAIAASAQQGTYTSNQTSESTSPGTNEISHAGSSTNDITRASIHVPEGNEIASGGADGGSMDAATTIVRRAGTSLNTENTDLTKSIANASDESENTKRNYVTENEHVDIADLTPRSIEQDVINKEIINLQDQLYIPDFELPTRSVFYVELNGGMSQSLITPSEKMSQSVGLGLGAQFQKGRFSFTTGVNGIWSFHDDIVLSRQAKVYSFGSEVYKYTLKYDHIYSLEAVLAVGYRMGNHQINVGVRPSCAIGSKVGFTLQGEKVKQERGTVYGHMEGVRRWGIKPMIGYSVDLRGGLTLGLNVGTQLLPAVNESYIDGKNNSLPIDGQLYIRKSIRFRR